MFTWRDGSRDSETQTKHQSRLPAGIFMRELFRNRAGNPELFRHRCRDVWNPAFCDWSQRDCCILSSRGWDAMVGSIQSLGRSVTESIVDAELRYNSSPMERQWLGHNATRSGGLASGPSPTSSHNSAMAKA